MAIAYFCDHCGAENAPGDAICHSCQQPLAQHAEVIGALLNERYEVLNEIGAGGFGAVYKARDTQEDDRLVAVKQINLAGLSSQEIIEATDAFNREAEILTTLSHPFLPTIFDRFSDPEHWYLVMTYIDGSTLDEYLQQQKVKSLPASAGLPLGETLEIAVQLCDALHYLHSQHPPVIFRDLKPGNIMRTRKGRLYLIDFGIARRFKPGQAKDTIPFGSPGFAAPEQYGKAQTTPQADIYSLGALLYCLLTGDDPSEHPFDFPRLHRYGLDGIHELDSLIQSMVALNPTKRPADIKEVQRELEHIQQLNIKANQQGHIWTPPQGQTPPVDGSRQQHIFLNPATNAQQQMRKTTRRRVLTTTLVLGGVAAFGGIIALASQSSPQPTSQPASSTDQNPDFYQQTVDAQNAAGTATVSSETPAVPFTGPTYWSSDLRYAATTHLLINQVELREVQSQKILQVIKVPSYFYSLTVQWSPDATKVLLIPDSANIECWNAQNGSQLFTLPLSASASYFPFASVWSPNSQYLATGSADSFGTHSTLSLWGATDGKQLFSQSIAAQSATNVLGWSPDSRYIAFAGVNPISNADWSVGIWDVTTFKQIYTLGAKLSPDLEAGSGVTSIAWSPTGDQLALIINNSVWVCKPTDNSSVSHLVGLDQSKQLSNLTWSPDQRRLAVIQSGTLAVLDIASGGVIPVTPNGPVTDLVAFTWSSDGQSIMTADEYNVIRHWSVG